MSRMEWPCGGCASFAGPTWDHADNCPTWPGSEFARRHGYMGNCGGLTGCDVTHPYDWHYQCGCEGECFYCSHVGCEGCVAKAWADRPWWRKLLMLAPGPWRSGWLHPSAMAPRR